jgi:integrase/recombinase XerD
VVDVEQSSTVVRAGRSRSALVVAPRIDDTLEGYRGWLAGRKLRPRAIDTYLRDLKTFVAFLGDEPQVADITLENIERFQADRAHLAGSTIAKYLTVVRSYCRYCIKKQLRADDPTLEIDWPHREETPPRALNARALRLLDRALEMPLEHLPIRSRDIRLRNRIAILLMLYAGLRLSETAALLWKDVDLDVLMLTVRNAKGGKFRVIPLHERLAAALRLIPDQARRGAVCGRGDGRPRSYKSLPHIFDRWLREEGLEISAHQLRHTFATQMLWNGANLREIQRLL